MLLETRDTFSPPQQNAQIILPDGVFPVCDRTRSPIIRPHLSQRFLNHTGRESAKHDIYIYRGMYVVAGLERGREHTWGIARNTELMKPIIKVIESSDWQKAAS